MKKLRLFSKIILIMQCLGILNLLSIPFLTHPFDAFDFLTNGLGFFLPFGMYVALPLGIIGFALETANVIISLKNKKPWVKAVIIAILHFILGATNYVFYISMWHI